MDLPENIDYESVEEWLAEAECETRAAELQAILCGMLAAGLKVNDKRWLQAITDIVGEGKALPDNIVTLTTQLLHWTNHQLSEQDTASAVLLPDDSYPVVDQVEALALWSQGFLLGFGLEVSNESVTNSEVKESLTDLSEISQLALEADDNDENQADLFTLIEHVKVVVQMIYLEIVVKNAPRSTTQVADNNTLH